MSAYYGTWSVISDEPVPPKLLALARKLVGSMLEINVPSKQVWLDDGSTIEVLIVNGIPKVRITQPKATTQSSVDTTDLWVPRGFVVYPAWSASPYGVGLPIIADHGAGPYDPANLAPGLDTARWTPGGPCGEVLLSPDKDAGYPSYLRELVVPLLFHPTKGPVFHWTGKGSYDDRRFTGAWLPYRMELQAPVQVFANEEIGAAEALRGAINTYRDAKALPPLILQPRGYYQPGKVMASIMWTNGTTAAYSAGYPDTYQTEADRVTKDGYSATLMGANFASWGRGDNPTSFELRASGGSAGSVLDGWKSVPATDAVLRYDGGCATFGDVMNRGGFWCADVISRSRWIGAGNCCWQSSDTTLPPLSWHGFASMNLAWETFPVTVNPDEATQAEKPLLPHLSLTDGHGDCWLNYPRSVHPTVDTLEPAMSRHIYTRGRAIALAPRGGLVWCACVAPVSDPNRIQPTVDRLVALVHHPEDQDADKQVSGYTRYLRVWWADIPRREHLNLDPQKTICGEALDDPWGWRGGDLIDVGMMPPPAIGNPASPGPNSLKMASQWRFASDGSKAICLRDYGALADYGTLYNIGEAPWVVRAFFGLQPRAVELKFNFDLTSTATRLIFHDYTGNDEGAGKAIAHPLGCTDQITDLYEYPTTPVAVDYDVNGVVRYAFTGFIDDVIASGRSRYVYMGTGSEGTIYPSELENRALMGAQMKTSSQHLYPWTFQVADVINGVFACEGSQPALTFTGAINTDAPCFPFSGAPSHGVRAYSRGRQLGEHWYPANDGLVFSFISTCLYTDSPQGLYADLPLALSRSLQVFAPASMGEQIVSYQLSPVPAAAIFLESAPQNPKCGCQLDIDRSMSWMTSAQLNPRGGQAWSSVPLPDNDWLIFAKAV